MDISRNCPSCFQVPEKQIYQCQAGHVICHLCIDKMEYNKCSVCKVSYGTIKIRCLYMEQVLDAQEFNCKFPGCDQLSKRGEITNHANACPFGRETIPLCSYLFGRYCKFKIGTNFSRAEIIAHYEGLHEDEFWLSPCDTWFTFSSRDLMCQLKKEKCHIFAPPNLVKIVSFDKLETSPIFLLCFACQKPLSKLLLICVKIWESGSLPSQLYNAEIKLTKASTTTTSSNSSTANDINLLPITSLLKVRGLKEAARFLKRGPKCTILSLDNGWGNDDNDFFCVRIVPRKAKVQNTPLTRRRSTRTCVTKSVI